MEQQTASRARVAGESSAAARRAGGSWHTAGGGSCLCGELRGSLSPPRGGGVPLLLSPGRKPRGRGGSNRHDLQSGAGESRELPRARHVPCLALQHRAPHPWAPTDDAARWLPWRICRSIRWIRLGGFGGQPWTPKRPPASKRCCQLTFAPIAVASNGATEGLPR